MKINSPDVKLLGFRIALAAGNHQVVLLYQVRLFLLLVLLLNIASGGRGGQIRHYCVSLKNPPQINKVINQ